MSANGVIPFDPGLVTQSVNYHGHNLLKHLVSENAAQIHTIKLQDIDYKIYQDRKVELRNLGGSRIEEIVGFIASKSDKLLVTQPKILGTQKNKDSDHEDRYKFQYPFEYFLNATKNIRIKEFMNVVEVGDILFAEVVNSFENTSFTSLKFIAYDEGKHRYLSDIKATDLKLILKNEDTIVSKADEDKIGRWMTGTRLRVEVLSIHTTNALPCLFVGTKGTTLESTKKEHIKLGKIMIKDLPQILSVTPDPHVRHLSDCIEKMNSYKNPQCIRQMASEINIDMRWYPTLFNSIKNDIADDEKAITLRKAQMCKWAHKNVADGVTHFKKGQHEEAFQCLNKALQIDPENVEAFVAKGALLANLGRYQKAIEDFEKSLASNPGHVNARKYMCETLVELGKQNEEKSHLKEAEKCYSRCLELNENHEVAREALNSVSRKLGPESSLMQLIKLESLKKEDSFMVDLLQVEDAVIKNRGQDNPIPTITSKASKMDSPHSIEDNEVEEEEEESQIPLEGSLSPLAQKLVDQEHSPWSLPPSSVDPAINNFVHSLAPPYNRLPMNMYSNPPPNWPVIDVSKPPPMMSVVHNAEDQIYKSKVEEFLKELETRSLGQRMGPKSLSGGEIRTKHKEEAIEKKRRRSKESSSSRSRSSSSNSSSSSSSSSSPSSSSSSDENTTVKAKRKSSKKSKKAKSKKKRKVTKKKDKEKKAKKQVLETAVPDFGDLEEKLKAYYKKMEEIQTKKDDDGSNSSSSSSSVRSSSESPKKQVKTKKSAKTSKESKKNNFEMTAKNLGNPLSSKLRQFTHPAFLDDESEEETIPGDAKFPRIIAPSFPPQTKRPVVEVKKVSSPPPAKARKSKSSSDSRSRSRGRRSESRGRRSRSKGRRSESRGRRSRSRGWRSRSRSRRSRSRSGSRSRRSRGYRSRSRSPRYRRRYSRSRSGSRHRFIARNVRERPQPRGRSPIGYYRNKPYVSGIKKTLEVNKNKWENNKNIDPKTKHMVEDAKRKIMQHLAGNTNKDSKTTTKKEEEKPVTSIDPANRFGKWANEPDGSKNNGEPKPSTPKASLAQFENFMKVAKEKNKELMKERNKAFLKPDLG